LAAIRQAAASLNAQCQAQVHSTAGVHVRVDQRDPCPRCGDRMNVQKTVTHPGMTLAHGSFEAHESVLECAAGCKEDGRLIVRRQSALAEILIPRSPIGYDVMTRVGMARFVEYQQREEIRAELKGKYDLALSSGAVSKLETRFLAYLEALHIKRAPELRNHLAKDGGWPMHVDATGEAGRGTLLVVYAGWRNWVLGSWKIPSEHADAILPRMRTVCAQFGAPCGVMHDLGRAVIEASGAFVKGLDQPIPDLVCHFHLARDVGKDLMAEAHDELRAGFRRHDVRSGLRAIARDLGRTLGTDIDPARKDVEDWMAISDRHHRVPSGRAGLATARALAQWILDYPADGQDEGFPFDVPYLDLFERCRKGCRALEAFLCDPPDDAKVHGYLKRLHRTVVVVRRPDFASSVRILQERRELLGELRTALQVEVKAHRAAMLGLASPQALDEIREVKLALDQLVLSLRERRPERGPAKDTREAIDIVLDHIDRHRQSLWGHAIHLPPDLGGGVRLIARTNILLEHFFGLGKRGERRRSGRKNLAADLEHLPGAAALAANLDHPDYVELLCGRLEDLPRAFAALDAGNRSQALPLRNAATANGADADVVRASMPKADRKIIRSGTLLEKKIVAAARSRAPRRADPQAAAATG
jgi:hypothetical protein